MKEQHYEDPFLEKCMDMMDYAYIALRQFPKAERFGLGEDIKHIMDRELELACRASKRYFKKTTLEDLDICNMQLRFYIRLSYKQGFLPPKKYELWSGKVVELGRIIGGWINSAKQ